MPAATTTTGCWSSRPLWQEVLPQPAAAVEPPRRVDVAVVGSGVTGLSAALHLARAGRSVAVLDAGEPGRGASTRNAGVLGWSVRADLDELAARHGTDLARRIYAEAREAFRHFLGFVRAEGIDADLVVCGRLMCVRGEGELKALLAGLGRKRELFGDRYEVVAAGELARELGSDAYHAAALVPEHAVLNPGRFMAGLLACAAAAGVAVVGQTRVARIEGQRGSFTLATSQGPVAAGEVILATNGYTDRVSRYLRRRVVPVDGFMLATAPLPADLLAACLPTGRCFHDLSADVEFGRIADRGTRLVFGGLTGSSPARLPAIAERLSRRLRQVFPRLGAVEVTHAWTGACAASFDGLPHLGCHEGVHHALGYSFASGLPQGLWLGRKLAARLTGAPDAATAFAETELPARLYYFGRRWFAPAIRPYLRLLGGQKA